ncbi:MAG: hypothetical protein DME84_08690, partial [Verrucomicrobia bacterium]
MEPLILAIIVLPFVALAKANSAKRDLDDLTVRLSSLENDLRRLGQRPVPAPEAEPPAPTAFAVPPPLPITAPVLPAQQKETVQPSIPQEFVAPSLTQATKPAKPPIDWEQFMGAKLFAWIG